MNLSVSSKTHTRQVNAVMEDYCVKAHMRKHKGQGKRLCLSSPVMAALRMSALQEIVCVQVKAMKACLLTCLHHRECDFYCRRQMLKLSWCWQPCWNRKPTCAIPGGKELPPPRRPTQGPLSQAGHPTFLATHPWMSPQVIEAFGPSLIQPSQ